MKPIKKLLTAIPIIASILLCALSPMASSTATLTVKKAIYNGETFTFRISVTDVTDPLGFALVEYTLGYDTTRFELVDAVTTLPEKWQPLSSNSDYYEDLSMLSKAGSYTCAHIMYMTGIGGASDEFYTDYTFRIIGKNAEGKTFTISDISIISDSITEMYSGGNIKFVCQTADEVSEEEEEVSEPAFEESAEETSYIPDESQKGGDVSLPEQSAEQSEDGTADSYSEAQSTEISAEEPVSEASEISEASEVEANGGADIVLTVIPIALCCLTAVATAIMLILRKKSGNGGKNQS